MAFTHLSSGSEESLPWNPHLKALSTIPQLSPGKTGGRDRRAIQQLRRREKGRNKRDPAPTRYNSTVSQLSKKWLLTTSCEQKGFTSCFQGTRLFQSPVVCTCACLHFEKLWVQLFSTPRKPYITRPSASAVLGDFSFWILFLRLILKT